jgi:transposase InsO family protein
MCKVKIVHVYRYPVRILLRFFFVVSGSGVVKPSRSQTLYIEPGCPWENGYNESFTGKLRDDLLRREIFCTPKEAPILIERRRLEYNTVRPQSALGYRPLAPEDNTPLL